MATQCQTPTGIGSKHGGRKREVNVREVLNGIFYLLATGCQWRALPKTLFSECRSPMSSD
jgi:transposase